MMNEKGRHESADPRGGVPSTSKPNLPSGEGVRPFEWVNTILGRRDILADPVPRVALALIRFAPGYSRRGTGWTFFLSESDHAELAACSIATVRRGRDALVRAGWLVKVNRGGGPLATVYALAIPAGIPLTSERSSPKQNRSPVSGVLTENRSRVSGENRSPVSAQGSTSGSTSSSSGLLGSGRARDEFANGDDEPRDERSAEVEPITADEVAEVVAASAGRWHQGGVRKYADEFARTFGRADALRRLNEAARDPSARTPRVAGFSKYAAASAERVETVEGPREPACRTCGLVERVCSRTLGSDHEFEPADEPVDHVEPTPTRRGGRRAAGDPDTLGNLVEGVLRP